MYCRKSRSNLQDQDFSGMGQAEDNLALHGKGCYGRKEEMVGNDLGWRGTL